MAAKSLRLVVRGTVQMVGYRRFVVREAARLGVVGHVRNLPDLSVEVVAKAEERALSKFIRAIGNPPEPASVESIARSPARVRGGVSAFTTKFGSMQEELQETVGGMETQFRDYRSEFKGFARRTNENFGALGGKLDSFAARTDENFRALGDKYGEISAKLSEILGTLTEQSTKTREMLETMRAEAKQTAEILNESLRLLRDAVARLPSAA